MFRFPITTILMYCFVCVVNAQSGKMYQFYDHNLKPKSFEQVAKKLIDYDVILFGEHHNNSTNHWLQLQLLKYIHLHSRKNIVIGAEMFERDNQSQLNAYLSNQITEDQFIKETRLWSNYKTDYKPFVDYAKAHQLKFIATNIPRRYASTLAKKGFEAFDNLTHQELEWIVKLPFNIDFSTPGYKEILTMMKDHTTTNAENFVAAQAIKDATMAESIFKNIGVNTILFHINGDYHSKEYGGIYWYLKKYNPQLKIAVIQLIEPDDDLLNIKKNNNKTLNLTEFNLVLPLDTIKTY